VPKKIEHSAITPSHDENATPTERLLGTLLSEVNHLHKCMHRIEKKVDQISIDVEEFKKLKQRAIGGSVVVSAIIGFITFLLSSSSTRG